MTTELYRKYAREVADRSGLEYEAYLLLTGDNEPCGVLFVDMSGESACIDSHCEDCWNEPVLVMSDKSRKHYPVGITWGVTSWEKFDRIAQSEEARAMLLCKYRVGEWLNSAPTPVASPSLPLRLAPASFLSRACQPRSGQKPCCPSPGSMRCT